MTPTERDAYYIGLTLGDAFKPAALSDSPVEDTDPIVFRFNGEPRIILGWPDGTPQAVEVQRGPDGALSPVKRSA